MELVKFKKTSLKNHPEITESFIQEKIANEPEVLGLGDLLLKDKERTQPGAGRLDISSSLMKSEPYHIKG